MVVTSKCRECKYKKIAHKAMRDKRRKGGRFFKALVAAVVLHGVFCVTMSYVLAWTEHMQVVEGLSSTIVTEIIAPLVVYGITKTVENVFQKNRLSFSTPIDAAVAGEETEAKG